MGFVDSHLHLDGRRSPEAVAFAKSAGAFLLACGVGSRSSESLVRISAESPGTVASFVGVHPSEAEKETTGWVDGLCKSADGIGEIGLDPTYSSIQEGSPQMRAFTGQLEAAERRGLPVQIHSRKAEGRVLDVLSGTRLTRILLHWLESEEAAPRAVGRGYFLSFGPALLYSKRLQRMAIGSDPSLTLLETDYPVSYGPLGGVSGPPLIPSVAFKLAELTGRSFSDTLEDCNRNALRFLGRSKG